MLGKTAAAPFFASPLSTNAATGAGGCLPATDASLMHGVILGYLAQCLSKRVFQRQATVNAGPSSANPDYSSAETR